MKSIVLAVLLVTQSAGNVQKILSDEAARLQAWGSDPAIVAAVKAQNAKHVSAAQVKALDEQWSDGKAPDLVKQVTTGPCADHLRSLVQAAHGWGVGREAEVMHRLSSRA